MAAKKEIRNIVRIVDTDLNGYLTVDRALLKIKGIGIRLAKIIANKFYDEAKLNPKTKLGEIDNKFDQLLEDIIRNPLKYKIPGHFLNRIKDIYTGETKLVINNDLDFLRREDYMRLMKIKTRRGLRLRDGLPVRGQKTHSNFRRGKLVVGVSRKK